jgi:hypothetical protein
MIGYGWLTSILKYQIISKTLPPFFFSVMFTSLHAWILLNKWWWHRNVVYLAQYDWLWLVYKYLKRSVRIFQNDPLNFWEYFTISRHVRHNALSLTLTFNGAFTDSCKPWQLIFSISLLLLRHGVWFLWWVTLHSWWCAILSAMLTWDRAFEFVVRIKFTWSSNSCPSITWRVWQYVHCSCKSPGTRAKEERFTHACQRTRQFGWTLNNLFSRFRVMIFWTERERGRPMHWVVDDAASQRDYAINWSRQRELHRGTFWVFRNFQVFIQQIHIKTLPDRRANFSSRVVVASLRKP